MLVLKTPGKQFLNVQFQVYLCCKACGAILLFLRALSCMKKPDHSVCLSLMASYFILVLSLLLSCVKENASGSDAQSNRKKLQAEMLCHDKNNELSQ